MKLEIIMATRIEFHQHGGPDVLKAVEFTPAEPQENEIQVENKAIGINYIDTYIRSGLYPPPSLPCGGRWRRADCLPVVEGAGR